ncbi:MAG: hypothetical protein K6G80_02610 [Treponema sp.]|nr:hypothetical protein [Treponema sp.]
MKKNIIAAAAFALLFSVVMTSCASTKFSVTDCGPVAIIAVNGNPALPWEVDSNDDEDADDGNGVLTTMVNKLVDGANPELVTGVDRLDYALDSLRAGFQDIASVQVIDTDVLLKSEQYVDMTESVFNMLDSKISATGFKTISTIGAKRARLLMEEIGAKSLVFVDFDFRKTPIQGNKWNGKIAPMLTMKVRVLNQRGKEVVYRTFVLKSANSVKASGRKYDKNELVGLYPELIDSAVNQFLVSYIQ